jgi:hypothetical protein
VHRDPRHQARFKLRPQLLQCLERAVAAARDAVGPSSSKRFFESEHEAVAGAEARAKRRGARGDLQLCIRHSRAIAVRLDEGKVERLVAAEHVERRGDAPGTGPEAERRVCVGRARACRAPRGEVEHIVRVLRREEARPRRRRKQPVEVEHPW